jgi:hypothetical protein
MSLHERIPPKMDKAGAPPENQDPMLAFTPESELTLPAVIQPAIDLAVTTLPPATPLPRRRIRWTPIVIGLVAAVAVIQTGLIVVWWSSGRIAGSAPETGQLTITSDPGGAPLSIDGSPRGSTPATLTLAAGSHQIEVGAGESTRRQSISLGRGGEATVHVSLAPDPAPAATEITTGALQISVDPPGLRVALDGQPRGTAPTTLESLPAGPHQVTVIGPDGPVSRRVTVQAGVTTPVIISLTGGGAFASGWLAVTSGVPAQILENGTLLGTTDTPRIMLPTGRHDLELTNEALGYRLTRSVQIGAGQTVSLQLEIPLGTLNVNATPWADVWIDGRSVGETPIGNLSLPIGSHEIVFRHPDLGEQRRTVAVGVTGTARVGVDFRK